MTPAELDEKARELRQALDNLPDHYEPGADGGMYRALPPEGADRLIRAALADVQKRTAREAARVVDDGWSSR